MSVLLRRIDEQTPVKLISEAGRLTVEWHKAFGIGVAKSNFQSKVKMTFSRGKNIKCSWHKFQSPSTSYRTSGVGL